MDILNKIKPFGGKGVGAYTVNFCTALSISQNESFKKRSNLLVDTPGPGKVISGKETDVLFPFYMGCNLPVL